jgi:hypothetical protein
VSAFDLAEFRPPDVHEVYGVFSFSRALGRHVMDEYDELSEAEQCRDSIRCRVDASAVILRRVDRTGHWTPPGSAVTS